MDNVNILKKQFGVICENEKNADWILKQLLRGKQDELASSIYGENKDGEFTKFYPKILANQILNNIKCINYTGNENDTYIYENGVYKKNRTIRNMINKRIIMSDNNPDHHRILTLKEIRESSMIDIDILNNDKNIINFENGIYDINKKTLSEHDSNIMTTIQVRGKFIKDAYKNINNTLFGHLINTSLTEESRIMLQEIFGYCLTLRLDAQKLFVFTGKGRNGKSQILKVLQNLYDKALVSALDFKYFQDDVRIFSLVGKVLNICSDISAEYIQDDSIIKKATGEDLIDCNPKYRDPLSFYCAATILFSCNELANVMDKSYGYFRRLTMLPFDKRIKTEDKINSIAEKIISSNDCMESVISWSILGLNRLMNNNWEFTQSERSIEIKTDYELNNNNVKRFINEFIIIKSKDSFIPVTELKSLYKRWCEIEDYTAVRGKKFENIISEFAEKRKNTLYKGWYYENIAWNNEIEDLENGYLLGTKLGTGLPLPETSEQDTNKIDYKPPKNINEIGIPKFKSMPGSDFKKFTVGLNTLIKGKIIVANENIDINCNDLKKFKGLIFLDINNKVCIPGIFDLSIKEILEQNFYWHGLKRFNIGDDYMSIMKKLQERSIEITERED